MQFRAIHETYIIERWLECDLNTEFWILFRRSSRVSYQAMSSTTWTKACGKPPSRKNSKTNHGKKKGLSGKLNNFRTKPEFSSKIDNTTLTQITNQLFQHYIQKTYNRSPFQGPNNSKPQQTSVMKVIHFVQQTIATLLDYNDGNHPDGNFINLTNHSILRDTFKL